MRSFLWVSFSTLFPLSILCVKKLVSIDALYNLIYCLAMGHLNNIGIGDHSRNYAEITDCKISLIKTFIGYRFRFDFTVTPFPSAPRIYLKRLDIDLSYRDNGSVHLLGRMIDDLYQNDGHKLYGNTFTLTKFYEITTDDFLRLIDSSHRGDMTFEFDTSPVLQNGELPTQVQKGSFKISQSEWLRLLATAQLDRFELITLRIPVASSHMHTPFSQALAKIREAEDLYIRGDWTGSAAACRSAWRTVLSSAPAGTKSFEHLLAPVLGNPRRKEFASAIMKGLHDIENAALHLEGDVKIGRQPAALEPADALLCIHWYSTMIGYLSSLSH